MCVDTYAQRCWWMLLMGAKDWMAEVAVSRRDVAVPVGSPGICDSTVAILLNCMMTQWWRRSERVTLIYTHIPYIYIWYIAWGGHRCKVDVKALGWHALSRVSHIFISLLLRGFSPSLSAILLKPWPNHAPPPSHSKSQFSHHHRYHSFDFLYVQVTKNKKTFVLTISHFCAYDFVWIN